MGLLDRLRVRTHKGSLDVTLTEDDNYPGVIIDILDKGGNVVGCVRVECPKDEENRVLIYEKNLEDYEEYLC